MSDNPYVPPKPDIEELTPDSCSTARVMLSFLAVPMFLYYLGSPFFIASMLHEKASWLVVIVFVWIWAYVFVIAYIAMLFRKIWGYFLCAVYAGLWTAQPFLAAYQPEAPDGAGPPFDGAFMLAEFVILCAIAIYSAAVLVLCVVCGLSDWRNRKDISRRTSSTANINH